MMSESMYDWSTFTKQVFIRASLEATFQAWVTPGGIIQWFIAQADYTALDGTERGSDETVQPGDRYLWRWHQDLQAKGEVQAVVPNQLFEFTFGPKEPASDQQVIVTVKFRAKDDMTLIELTQRNMADTPEARVHWHMSCNLGWSFFMTNLKAWLEHGVDLRETDPQLAYASRAITLQPALRQAC